MGMMGNIPHYASGTVDDIDPHYLKDLKLWELGSIPYVWVVQIFFCSAVVPLGSRSLLRRK